MQRTIVCLFLSALLFVISACSLFSPNKPTVLIDSPPSSSQYQPGEQVQIQSTAKDASGITRVELYVDGKLVNVSTPTNPQPSYTATQTWTATDGVHTISVRAYNTSNTSSDPAEIAVLSSGTALTPLAAPPVSGTPPTPGVPTLAPSASGNCTNNSTFVQDVTIPDGTTIGAGQAFNKVWRLQNSGTCVWTDAYRLAFVGGTGMTKVLTFPVPSIQPGGTVDVSVPMNAPTRTGRQTSLWQMQTASGALFGVILNATISVPGAASSAQCSGAPVITSFTASPTTITAGQSATLTYGLVQNADTAEIDQNIGGVATPGSVVVSPTTTTNYTMTARCGSTTTTATVTITVTSPAPTIAPTVAPTAAATPTATQSPTSPAGGTVVRCSIQSESGEAIKSGAARSADLLLNVGDNNANGSHRILTSFDISDLKGRTIDTGNLTLAQPFRTGDPVHLGQLLVQTVQYNPPVVGSDYDLSGSTILSITGLPRGSYDVRSALQNALSADRSLLQLRLQTSEETNNDSRTDMYTWGSNNDICLSITFH